MEEPPAKVTKFEMESQYLEGEVMDEGQEEWLSEGILTDDDYNNPGSQQTEVDQTESNIASHDDSMNEGSADDGQCQMETSTQFIDSNVGNIEETLNNLENSEINNQTTDFPEELNAFLIRKTDGKIVANPQKKESDIDESAKQSEDDGNDTDDLLRVLGDGEQASQEISKEKLEETRHDDSSDDDDNYIFEGKKVKNFHVAQSILTRAPATKAVPEDDDPTDCSSDEGGLVQKVRTVKVKKSGNVTPQITTSVKPGNFTITPLQTKQDPPKKKIIKKVVDFPHRPTKQVLMSPVLKPVRSPTDSRRQYVNTRPLRGGASLQSQRGGSSLQSLLKPRTEETTTKKQETKQTVKQEHIQMDEDSNQKRKEDKLTQKLMCPEEMDEEVPTDAESDSDEDSLYSELPSSDSDTEDWFRFNITSERAGEFLPLLGDKAYLLLSEEKRRVESRLDTLKKSLSSLSTSGRELAEQLREATNTVAELDALLKVV